MSQTIHSYTSSQALEMIKAEFPNDYLEKIDTEKKKLIRLKKMFKKESFTEAYQKYLNYGCREESGIVMLCALQQLVEEEKNSLPGLIAAREKLLEQQTANENATNINPTDKRLLRQFYREKIDEHNAKIDEHINAFEVVDAVIVTQPNLFSDIASA